MYPSLTRCAFLHVPSGRCVAGMKAIPEKVKVLMRPRVKFVDMGCNYAITEDGKGVTKKYST